MPNAFSRLVSLAHHHKQVFGRAVTCEVYTPDEGFLAITRMHDDFHDLSIALLIDAKSLVILSIEGSMGRIPYPECHAAESTLQTLVGLNVSQKGVLKEVRNRISRSAGCTHFGEMIESSFRSFFAAWYTYQDEHKQTKKRELLTLEERRQLNINNPLLGDSCVSFQRRDADPLLLDRARAKLPAP